MKDAAATSAHWARRMPDRAKEQVLRVVRDSTLGEPLGRLLSGHREYVGSGQHAAADRQSPPLTSSMTTHVTGRIASPSTDTIASVILSTICCFWTGENTPSMSLTLMSGIAESFLR